MYIRDIETEILAIYLQLGCKWFLRKRRLHAYRYPIVKKNIREQSNTNETRIG